MRIQQYLLALAFLALLQVCRAQTKVISYEESNEDIVNPERGFYVPSQTKASNFKPLDEAILRSYRTEEQKIGRASYAIKTALIYRAYELDTFKEGPLSEEFLQKLQEDFDIVRRAGVKMILRFAYTNRSHKGDCPDGAICPPYGDASRLVVLNHIAQLKPLLQKNGDVIAVLQEGFIGIWGENYYTDYFGDASKNGVGRILDSNWLQRNEVLKALLNAMPKDRMVQVRTPQIKQKYVYGPSAPVTSKPLAPSEALNSSDKARIGFHNDCFLASADDYGTYNDNGSSTQPARSANEVLRRYIEADTKYTAVGGETCDDTFSPQNDCEPAGYAEQEMQRMHYSYLNTAYNNNVNNDWDSAGCMMSIKTRLGYRIVLKTFEAPVVVKTGSSLVMKFSLINKGYAAPFNPRPVFLVLRNKQTNAETRVRLKADPRTWFTGAHQFNEKIDLPGSLAAGNYALFLALPDASPSVSNRPEYSLVFANKDIVEASTAYMNLNADLHVR
jgi:hypothetical protein